MLILLILPALAIFILMQTIPAYCGEGSRTLSLQVSATLPQHVMTNSGTQLSNNPNQLAQTQMVVRNNKNISLTTVVVP